MWFKNLKLYRLAPKANIDWSDLEEKLQDLAFSPGGSQDSQVSGWVPVQADSGLAFSRAGQVLLRLQTEKKLLPTTVINQAAKERAIELEAQQGFKPGRKQLKELKEQIKMELLPRAFVIAHDTWIWLDTQNHWVAIDAASTARSDELLGLLAKTMVPFPIMPLHVNLSPAVAMTDWLASDEPPPGFSIDQDTELRSSSESRATVRYVRQSLEPDEVKRHIEAGKQCTRLALTWNDKLSFVLTDSLDIRRLAPLDILTSDAQAQAQDAAGQFEADLALMSGELHQMLTALVAALDGFAQ